MHAKTKVMPFARITGQLVIIKPYMNQPNTPKLNKLYMGSEMPDKSRDFHECRACGTKEKVVKKQRHDVLVPERAKLRKS